MFRIGKWASFALVCAAGVSSSAAVLAECPCKKANVYQISQVVPPAPAPGSLTPIPMPQSVGGPIAPPIQPGLPPAPPPGLPPLPTEPNVAAPGQIKVDPIPPGQIITPTPIAGDYAPLPPSTGSIDRPGTNRFGMTPPPGTLGRTYQQRSRIFDDEKHPRMAAVDVFLPQDVDVSARGMKSVWTGKHWRLEAKDPLLPGMPHIYAIKAVRKSKEGEVLSTDVRWIRLIPGRVVDLQF